MNLRYVVLTSVDRDDLPDMGAEHWRRTVEAVRRKSQAKIEVLLPDFQSRDDLLDIVLQSHPDVVAHNIETVRRLTPSVRSVATYDGSLHVLKHIHDNGFVTKSGLMLGLGETEEEVLQTLRDLRDCGVERVTIGQYLQPTAQHLAVEDYITPAKFQWYHEQALLLGFRSAVCGPLVRSSYKASIG
jgi:lipoic acid synthetase